MTLRPDEPNSAASSRWCWWLLVALVLVLGISLRFHAYDRAPGMPDDTITTEVVGYMRRSGDWDVNWRKADLTPDLKYDQYNFSTHLYGTFFFYRAIKLVPGADGWRGRDNGVVVYRFFIALLGAVVVWQTFRLGLLVGGLPVGALAAALTGVAPLLVQDSHYLRPEALTTVLTLLAAALVLRATPRDWRAPAAAFCIGLLVACKVSMLLLAWLPFVPLMLARGDSSGRLRQVILIVLALCAGFLAGAPTAVAHPAQFFNGVRHLMTQYGGVHPPHSHVGGAPVADMIVLYCGATLGWPILICWIVSVYDGWRRRRFAEMMVISGPVVLFFGYFATRSVFFERNLSHVIPLALIVTAQGAGVMVAWFSTCLQRRPAWLAVPLVLALLLTPTRITASLVGVEYTGRGHERREHFEGNLRARFPKAELWHEALVTDEPLQRLAERLRQQPGPVLLCVPDYRDDWTALNMRNLLARFDLDAAGVDGGSFGGVSTCTLLTYHSAMERYFIVRGAKTPSPNSSRR